MGESQYNRDVSREDEPASAAAGRQSWPVRVSRLGEKGGDDLSGITTAAQRLDMMWPLTVEACALTGRPLPVYARAETPGSVRPSAKPSRSRS
jgi:hypothetical protein